MGLSTSYITVFDKPKDTAMQQAAVDRLLDKLATGWVILSAISTANGVHYIIQDKVLRETKDVPPAKPTI